MASIEDILDQFTKEEPKRELVPVTVLVKKSLQSEKFEFFMELFSKKFGGGGNPFFENFFNR
jgi:hypothetical protein